MSQQTFRAIASQIEVTGNWLVMCLRCGEEIGTMTVETLQKAVFRNAGRGGVLCPTCRSGSCLDCGQPVEEISTLPKPRVCVICELERSILCQGVICIHDEATPDDNPRKRMVACPKCVEDVRGWSVGSSARLCLSSISYLKPEEKNTLPLSTNVPVEVLESDDFTDEYIAAMWEDEKQPNKHNPIDTDFVRQMKAAGYTWLDEDKAISTGFCLDEDYVYGPKDPQSIGGEND